MTDLDKLREDLQKVIDYTDAIITGVEKFIGFVPTMIDQHIKTLANKRLDKTKDAFLDAVSMSVESDYLVVILDPDNWLANAVESGADSFDMKETHLKSPKAKTSKSGHKYMVIPIKRGKSTRPGGTEKAQMYQQAMNEALTKPKYGPRKVKIEPSGEVNVTQALMTSDPLVKGTVRNRRYKSVKDYHEGTGLLSSQHVTFRVMSEKQAKDKWVHPGITPVSIFKDTEYWFYTVADASLDQFIQNELRNL